MAEYRVYSVDSQGHILGPADIVICENDEQAIDSARKLKKHFTVEVWQANRVIAKIK